MDCRAASGLRRGEDGACEESASNPLPSRCGYYAVDVKIMKCTQLGPDYGGLTLVNLVTHTGSRAQNLCDVVGRSIPSSRRCLLLP